MPMQSSWLPKNKRKCEIRIKSKQKKKKERKRSKTEKAPFKSFNIEPLFWMIYYRYYSYYLVSKDFFILEKSKNLFAMKQKSKLTRERPI